VGADCRHVYTFEGVCAAIGLRLKDYYSQGNHRRLRLHEKNGKKMDVPCHPRLADFLDEYIAAAGTAEDRKG
jgi:integrase/recombinase XerD